MWPRRNELDRESEVHHLRDAMRSAHRSVAVIRVESHGISIEMSNGGRCYWPSEHCYLKKDAIGAAVQWARRHGAATIEIDDTDSQSCIPRI